MQTDHLLEYSPTETLQPSVSLTLRSHSRNKFAK